MSKSMLPVMLLLLVMAAGCGEDDRKSFGRVDLNKDGKVIFEEGVIAYPDLTVEEFRLYDKDGGGALSGEEYEVFVNARKSGTPPPAKPAAEPAPAPPAQAVQAPPPGATPGPDGATQPEPAQPAAPAQPDAPPILAPQDTPPHSAAPVQSVEVSSTSITPEPEKKPAGPSEIAYTVQRGDTLNKIARKFKVDVKDIMTRNKIDNPDKVAAGQVLDIPLREGAEADGGAAGVATGDMAAFVEAFFVKSGAASPDELVALYAEEVDFYKKGVVKKDFVFEDKVRYFERWPHRAYTLVGKPTVAAVPGTKRTRIDAPVRYQVKNSDKSATGEALFVFEVVTENGSPRIVFEDSTVTSKP